MENSSFRKLEIEPIIFSDRKYLNNYLNTRLHDDRLQGQEEYLIHASVVKALYPSVTNKHKHCEFCKAKFGIDEKLKQGYATKDRYYWICENCFEDFKDLFKFRLIKNRKADRIKFTNAACSLSGITHEKCIYRKEAYNKIKKGGTRGSGNVAESL